MINVIKGESAAFSIQLLEFTTIATHGYLFKLVNQYDSEEVVYFTPSVLVENMRFTTFEYDFEMQAGNYVYRVYEYDNTLPTPTDETGLNELAVGRLKVEETITSGVYL